jgi:hypothetical protein
MVWLSANSFRVTAQKLVNNFVQLFSSVGFAGAHHSNHAGKRAQKIVRWRITAAEKSRSIGYLSDQPSSGRVVTEYHQNSCRLLVAEVGIELPEKTLKKGNAMCFVAFVIICPLWCKSYQPARRGTVRVYSRQNVP